MTDLTSETGAPTATLCLSDVRLPMPDLRGGELTIDLTLAAGALAVLSVGESQHVQIIAEAACGLRQPLQGSVAFQGQDWQDSTPDYANARRGRIGCMIDDTAWLPYVSLADNILLPTLYHTKQTHEEALTEATRLARRLGFIGLPMGYPDDYSDAELRRAAFVRAFLGQPDLILLSAQTGDFAHDRLARLLNMMRQARDGGTAILWFVPDDAFGTAVAPDGCRRYTIQDNRLVEETVS